MNRRCIGCGLAALTTLMTGTACYRYVPAEIETTPPGTGVQLLVTRNGAREAEEAGALEGDEPRVKGTVERIEGDDLLLRVPVAQRQRGFTTNQIDQSVRVPIGEIVSFQRREMNALATSLIIGGAVVGVGAMVAVIVDPFGWSNGDTEPPPDELFLSIPFPSFLFGR